MGGGICDSLMADNLCLVFVFLVTSQSNEKNKSRLSLRYDCANYSWLFGDNPDLWKPECIDVLSSKKTLNIIPTLNLLDLDSNPRPVPPDMAPAKKPKYISIYLWDDKKKMCALKKTKRFVRIYVLKIKDKKDYLIFVEFVWLK